MGIEFSESKYNDAMIALMQHRQGIELFDHQVKAVSATYDNMKKWRVDGLPKYQRQIGVSPTGSGKTVMLFSIAHLYMNLVRQIEGERGRVLILVHTKSLMYQIAERAENKWGYYKVGLIGDDVNTARNDSDLVIAIVQSLGGDNLRIVNRRLAQMGAFSLVIVDECHRAVTETHANAIAKFVVGKTALLGVTATFERSDSVPMSKIFTHTAFVIQPLQLRKDNFLANPNYYYPMRPNGQMRVKPVKPDEEVAWSEYYHAWLSIGGDKMKTIVFTETKKYAKEIFKFMRKREHNVGYIVAETPMEEREWIANNCDVIININTMTEGIDVDGLQCAIITRVSKHNTLFYVQRAGRVMRPFWQDGKPVYKDAYIIAPKHHDLLATIPQNVIDIHAAWLDIATRNLASYLNPEDEAWINEQLDDLQDDFLITQETFNSMPSLSDVRAAYQQGSNPKAKRKAKKPEPKVWYYEPAHDRTRQRRQRQAAKTQRQKNKFLSRIKSVVGLMFLGGIL